MKYDIVLAGVGGQGVLSVAAVIAQASMLEGLQVRQSEVHGMAQRGGAVVSHMRIAHGDIPGDLIGKGNAELILSMEPLESLRYLPYLAEKGRVITASAPLVNIPDYPDERELLAEVKKRNQALIVDAKGLAREAGNMKATNMVMVGAASRELPLSRERFHEAIKGLFGVKGTAVVEGNIKAFELGRQAQD